LPDVSIGDIDVSGASLEFSVDEDYCSFCKQMPFSSAFTHFNVLELDWDQHERSASKFVAAIDTIAKP